MASLFRVVCEGFHKQNIYQILYNNLIEEKVYGIIKI